MPNDVSDEWAALETLVAYVRAGRKYEGLSLDKLTSQYITAAEVAVSVPNQETVRLLDDLTAEFELRTLPAPDWVLAMHHVGIEDLRRKANGAI